MTKEKINDILLRHLFKDDKVNVNKIRCRRYSNVRDYLMSYFNDKPRKYVEILYRMKYDVPRNCCLTCGNLTYFKGVKWYEKTGKLYADFCSCKCSLNSESTKKAYKDTCLRKYGVSNAMKSPSIVSKGKNTCIEKYGFVRASLLKEYQEKAKLTNMSRYGASTPIQNPDIKERIHDTCLRRYGCASPLGNKDVWRKSEETTYAKYGVRCVLQTQENKKKATSKETRLKRYLTLQKNSTFNTSKIEDMVDEKLRKTYKEVYREYNKDERYPWRCDFYIKDIDLFLEVQGFWTHGTHPYDESSQDDVKLREEYEDRYGVNCNVVKTWTITDVRKRSKAKEEGLRFLELFKSDIQKIQKDNTILITLINKYLEKYDNRQNLEQEEQDVHHLLYWKRWL